MGCKRNQCFQGLFWKRITQDTLKLYILCKGLALGYKEIKNQAV